MEEFDYTPWFPGNIKPVHLGVYQQKNSFCKLGYQYWDGHKWGTWHTSPENAVYEHDYDPSHYAADEYQNDSWRGILKFQDEPEPDNKSKYTESDIMRMIEDYGDYCAKVGYAATVSSTEWLKIKKALEEILNNS